MKKKYIYHFDLKKILVNPDRITSAYNKGIFLTTLQGIVNKNGPRLIYSGLPYNWGDSFPEKYEGNIDKYFWEIGSRPGSWLEEYQLKEISSLEKLLEIFVEDLKGIVLWDSEVEATVNVATTIAGVENAAVVMAPEPEAAKEDKSLYHWLNSEFDLNIIENLKDMFTGKGEIGNIGLKSTGSAKNDAYLWALEKYLKTGKCNPGVLGYYEDAYARKSKDHWFHWIGMRDYLVANKGFVCDLSVWEDETPVDDPNQVKGTDFATLEKILKSANEQIGKKEIIKVIGFIPWAEKYTTKAGGSHEPVPTEWKLVKEVTPYDGHMAVDIYQGFTANTSLHSHASLPSLKQNKKPSSIELENKTYILFYMGDYCDIGAVYSILPGKWEDSKRGDIPLAWSYGPLMAEFMPDYFKYIYNTKTENDWFMAGPGTYGYNMPNFLPDKDAYEKCFAISDEQWKLLDLDINGFFIGYNEPEKETLNLYSKLGAKGTLTNCEVSNSIYKNMPLLRMHDLTPGENAEELADKAMKFIKDNCKSPGEKPNFIAFRCIWVEPSLIKDTVLELKEKFSQGNTEVLDPYTFFDLLKEYYTKF